MGIWQIVMIVLYAMNLGISLIKHGETEIKKYNFWVTLISTVISVGILWAGGFF